MQLGADLQSLDGNDNRAIELGGENQTGIDRLAVEKNRASAAIAGAAAFLGSGNVDLITQQVEQKTMAQDFTVYALTVQCELDSLLHTSFVSSLSHGALGPISENRALPFPSSNL